MRTVVLLLLLANLTFFAYTRLDSAGGGEAVRLAEQVQPDKIRLLTPQQVAALGPGKVAALADVCLEWGPHRCRKRPGRSWRSSSRSHWASCSRSDASRPARLSGSIFRRAANRAEAERRAVEVRARGIGDVSIVDNGPQRHAVALGAFVTEEAAKARHRRGRAAGRDQRQGGAAPAGGRATLFVIRDPQAPVIARMRDLGPAYPGSEAKIGNCEKTQ